MLVWTRCGSSPRMWGTPGFHHDVNVPPRFIPTHVGNTIGKAIRPSRTAGSSPRMWGTLPWRNHRVLFRRFIPTHVGNTHFLYLSITSIPVHPPACGEHSLCPQESLYICGSSPRMWGTPHALSYPLGRRRFIPTHVGNTSPRRPSTSRIPVHPHACGEHQTARYNRRHYARFIPTHVGNTRRTRHRGEIGSVHPHACGEHDWDRPCISCGRGSSPRMWGTHLPYSIVFKEEKTPRKIYRLILYSVVRSRGWNATNCSPSNNTGCRRLTPRVWNS